MKTKDEKMTLPVTQTDIDLQAAALLEGVIDGDGLSDLQKELIKFSLSAGAPCLDVAGAAQNSQRARSAGATTAQLQEAITLQSSIGVHAFFEASRILVSQELPLSERGPFDTIRQTIWDRHIGERKYWNTMREEIPGFLESLLWLSPESFEAFIVFVAVPFQSPNIDTVTKEIISMASDASVSHRYLPGMRMHLRNAVRMGTGRKAILEALDIAAHSSSPVGVR